MAIEYGYVDDADLITPTEIPSNDKSGISSEAILLILTTVPFLVFSFWYLYGKFSKFIRE